MKLNDCWLPEAQQKAFRAVLDGFARPGTQVMLGSTDTDAALVFLALLLDESVTLADTTGRLGADLRRLLLAPDAASAHARFVLLDGSLPPAADFQPCLGTLESPELGATLVLDVTDLSSPQAGSIALDLRGPGIDGQRVLHVSGLHPAWLSRRALWIGDFPLGVDLVLCAPDRVVVLPRTTHIEFTGT
jgi:alpha-D-ribose 1-methylphosphonate 5-triphosphate synthase subunit PhnH